MSSPIVGTKQQKAAKRRKKGQVTRTITQSVTKESQAKESRRLAEESQMSMREHFDDVLQALVDQGYTFYQLMLYVFDPVHGQGATRWDGFFNIRNAASRILDLWVAQPKSNKGQQDVHRWTVGYIVAVISREARDITSAGWLQSLKRPLNAAYVLGFDMMANYTHLRADAPTAMQAFSAFATGPRHEGVTEQRKHKKQMVSTFILTSM